MSKLACNIAMYHPDLRVISAKYRSWQVESLLREASTLIERCLTEYRKYLSLDYDWTEFQLDLQFEEKRFDFGRVGEAEEVRFRETAPPAEETVEEADPTSAAEEPAAEEEAEPTEEAPQMEPAPEPSAPLNAYQLRAEIARRRRELASPGQPFALDYQRDLTLRLVCHDYEEAVNRAWVSELGLRKLYDHSELTSPLPTEAETLGESITNLALWIRSANEWLMRYKQHEQAFTRTVSLRSLLGRTAWSVLKQSRDGYTARVRIPAELFRGHDNCHLRGIGAWLVGDVGTVPWTMIVRLPEEAVYERWGQNVEVDQSARSACLLGRVENRRSLHPVELSGGNSLLNASPIGLASNGGFWVVDISKPAGAITESFTHLEDVVLELSVVGIPQRNMGA